MEHMMKNILGIILACTVLSGCYYQKTEEEVKKDIPAGFYGGETAIPIARIIDCHSGVVVYSSESKYVGVIPVILTDPSYQKKVEEYCESQEAKTNV